jgi:MoaA/NifB/PqqE/SkfB family radical SAM enzyme
MTIEQIKKTVNSLKEKLDIVCLTGGETFLRDDLVDICKIYSKKTDKIRLTTNGLLTDKIYNTVKQISSEIPNPITIQVSLDGLEKTHNEIRGIKIFKQVIKTVKKLKKLPVQVKISTVLMDKNYRNVVELNDFVRKKLGVEQIFELVRGEPKWCVNSPPIKDLDNLLNSLRKINFKMYDKFHYNVVMGKTTVCFKTLKENRKKINCTAGNVVGVIYTNGDVSICELLKPFGNLRDTNYDFHKLWERRPPVSSSCFCTHSCFLGPAVFYSPMKMLKAKLGMV